MDINNIKGLMEAYQQVHAPQENVEQIDEAEGSYGQTPKAKKAMGALANARRNKPATEYSQKGEKTKKVKSAQKHFDRQDVLSRGLSGGKKSSRPQSGRGKMDADERAERRAERAFDLGTTYGAGSVTKNPKKLRKQKALGEIGEELDIFDVVLEFLQAEGFAETLEEAEWMMANLLGKEEIGIIVEASCEDDDEEEMKKGKKSKKSEEDDEDEEDEEDGEDLEEASYSAKAARAGKDIGKPGKAFAKIAKSAAKRYGSKERGEKVAGAVLAKLRAKRG
jgi:hypothetical protein